MQVHLFVGMLKIQCSELLATSKEIINILNARERIWVQFLAGFTDPSNLQLTRSAPPTPGTGHVRRCPLPVDNLILPPLLIGTGGAPRSNFA